MILRSFFLTAAIMAPLASLGAQSPDPSGSATDAAASASQQGGSAPSAAADVKAGAAVKDSAGVAVGTVKEVKGDEVVIETANGPIQVKKSSIGEVDGSLAVGATKAEIDAAVQGAATKQ